MLTLDHVILRTAKIETALATLLDHVDAPVLAQPTSVNGIRSSVVRAGPIDIELLEIGAEPPASTLGYGLGFVADRPLDEALAALRAAGFPTSAPIRASVGRGAERRSWRAAQVHGLLPAPFPVATTARPYGWRDRSLERVASAVARLPGVAAAATRDAGGSMVVITEYGFDADAYRINRGSGPPVTELVVQTAGHLRQWSNLPLAEPRSLKLQDGGPPGISRLTFGQGSEHEAFELGQVRCCFAHRDSNVGGLGTSLTGVI